MSSLKSNTEKISYYNYRKKTCRFYGFVKNFYALLKVSKQIILYTIKIAQCITMVKEQIG